MPGCRLLDSIAELNTGAVCAGGTAIIDDVLATGQKSGYSFVYGAVATNGINTGYTIVATPQSVGSTGQRGFYSDESGVIRYTLDGSAPSNASSSLE